MVMASLGEETRASCRGPSNHNAVALILPHKAMIGFDGGAIGADIYCDRTGIHARRIGDAAKILDALRDLAVGYYDPRDPYTTVPRSTVLASYTRFTQERGEPGALAGLRIGVIRESMLNPGVKLVEPITTAAAAEIKSVLGGRLGATLVESSDPAWTPDPDMEKMTTDFRRALARLVPVFMPDILFRTGEDGGPLFPDFAAAIQPTEFLPGKTFGGGTMAPMDYLVGMAEGRIPPPAKLDIATIQQQELAPTFRFHISQYLMRRAADWQALGVTETLADWAALNARSKFWGDDQRSAFKNWEEVADPRNPLSGRQGVNERIMLRELLRRADMMVIIENKLDALVRLHTPLPPGKIGGAGEPGTPQNLRLESLYGPNAGLTEVLIPAGYVTTTYDPVFKLSNDRTRYVPTLSDEPTALAVRQVCHSPWCSVPNSAARTWRCGLPRRTRRHPCDACHPLPLDHCRWKQADEHSPTHAAGRLRYFGPGGQPRQPGASARASTTDRHDHHRRADDWGHPGQRQRGRPGCGLHDLRRAGELGFHQDRPVRRPDAGPSDGVAH